MDYSKLNDHELNCKVALNFYDSDWVDKHWLIADMIPDYCNNPADAWPIIVANKIWIRELYGIWDCKGFPVAPHPYAQVQFSDANPLRAAMIVFLMIQEAKNG